MYRPVNYSADLCHIDKCHEIDKGPFSRLCMGRASFTQVSVENPFMDVKKMPNRLSITSRQKCNIVVEMQINKFTNIVISV